MKDPSSARLSTIAVLVLMVVSPVACVDVPTSSNLGSITPQGANVGKWLASVSIGGEGLPRRETEILANIARDVFSSPRGGGYNVAFQVSDWSSKGLRNLRKRDLLANFAALKKDIQEYKSANPGRQTMLVLTMTGHGHQENGYEFLVNDKPEGLINNKPESFSGLEIANLVLDLGVNETILFVQSCQSGGLVNTSFPASFSAAVQQTAARNGINIAVITPASSSINSPGGVWENEILGPVLKVIPQGKDFITYRDFKDGVMRAACSNPSYFPGSLLTDPSLSFDTSRWLQSGIDPQFFENIPADLPLVLSLAGIQKWTNGTLPISSFGSATRDVPISQSTQAICSSRRQKLHDYWNLSATDLRGFFLKSSMTERWTIVSELVYRAKYSLAEKLDFLDFAATNSDPDVAKRVEYIKDFLNHPPSPPSCISAGKPCTH